MKLVFFRIPKPNRFKYAPRYYDEEKERMEQRKKELDISGSNDKKIDFKAQVNRRWRRSIRKDRAKKKASMISFVVYLIILLILIYFI